MRSAHLGARAIVALISALLAMSVQATAQDAAGDKTGALRQEAPTSPIAKNGDAVDPAEPTGPTGSGMIPVSKRSIEVLAGASSSASALYGFPAGRPFRLIGRNAGFAQIQDLKSGAAGRTDETALAVAPSVAVAPVPSESPATSVPSEPRPAPLNQTAERRDIFGSGPTGGQGVLSGLLGGVFGNH